MKTWKQYKEKIRAAKGHANTILNEVEKEINGMNVKEIQTTQDYFKMTKSQLAEIRNEYGYTREDNKILDEGLKVYFFDDLESIIEEEIKGYEERSRLELKVILATIDNRYAVIFS